MHRRIVTITPELARELLSRSGQPSRALSQAHIERLAAALRSGEWKYNGDTIKISENHEVLDGQHRLWAIVKANRAIETTILSEQDVPLEQRGFGVLPKGATDDSE